MVFSLSTLEDFSTYIWCVLSLLLSWYLISCLLGLLIYSCKKWNCLTSSIRAQATWAWFYCESKWRIFWLIWLNYRLQIILFESLWWRISFILRTYINILKVIVLSQALWVIVIGRRWIGKSLNILDSRFIIMLAIIYLKRHMATTFRKN